MKENLTSETHYGRPETLAVVDTRVEIQCGALHIKDPAHSEGTKNRNVVNTAFADFLVGICLGDGSRQHDAWNLLMRFALAAARKSGFLRSLSGDYEQVALDCLFKETQKYANLKAYEIVQRHEANKFAYMWNALIADYIDEMRKIKRRGRHLTDVWRQHSDGRPSELVEELSAPCKYIQELEARWNRQSVANEFQKAAKFLPIGPAAISKFLAELFRNHEELQDFTNSGISDTACKTRSVEYVAQQREVDAQVVRKDLKQFRNHSESPEYARILKILRNASPHNHWDFAFHERNENEAI